MKDMEIEKQAGSAEDRNKYRSELLTEVRKDMGLPTLPVPNSDLSTGQHPGTSYPPHGNKHSFSSQSNLPPRGITPSGLLAKVKQEKYHRSELGNPDNLYKSSATTSPHGEKWQLEAGGDSTPPTK